ncbi:hypothetical protein C8Z91_28205 [Paenibacillus elgii]|uniref:Uncharacterized protein n=1 Tax=Paenibacillus elgii TaxID=189691 RepID=A0A2T6FVB8_9BACL|nr:hypothetical protein [Paenibacillus elgii]PUA35859.1 hypothetical protein C8Z91_28205 [Paenibacillus elgii]
MNTNPFADFEAAGTAQELAAIQESIRTQGFTSFRLLLEGFRDRLKQFSDGDIASVNKLLAQAKQLFPEPETFSPSWRSIWDEFERIAAYKQTVLETIPAEEREGEWQVLLDNPYTNSDLVCYPGLSFLEGAYLYAYFRSDLKQNEYIRLQKIQNLVMAFGSERQEAANKNKEG